MITQPILIENFYISHFSASLSARKHSKNVSFNMMIQGLMAASQCMYAIAVEALHFIKCVHCWLRWLGAFFPLQRLTEGLSFLLYIMHWGKGLSQLFIKRKALDINKEKALFIDFLSLRFGQLTDVSKLTVARGFKWWQTDRKVVYIN